MAREVFKGELSSEVQHFLQFRGGLPAIGFVLGYLKAHNPGARVVAIVNEGLKPAIAETVKAAAKKFGCDLVLLSGVSKRSGHPDPLGMTQIKD